MFQLQANGGSFMNSCVLASRSAMSNTAVSVMDVEGVLDINTVGAFDDMLQEFFRKKQYKIIINFEKLTYISSAGIGVLVGFIKDVRKNKGDIKLTGVNQDIYNVLDLLDLPGLFQILKNEREAAEKF